jgi:hypothetical protein
MPLVLWIGGVALVVVALLGTMAVQSYRHSYGVYPWETGPPATVTRCGVTFNRWHAVGDGPGNPQAPFPVRKVDLSFGSPLGPEFAVYDSASPSARTAPGAPGETCPLVFYLKTGSHSFVEYDMQP